LSLRLSRHLSRFADLIITNSHSGREYHVGLDYPADRTIVIHNGVDTHEFDRDPEAGHKLRREWGIGEHERLIAVIGRLDPMKDHSTFLRAAALLARQRQDVRFICVGTGPAHLKEHLRALSRDCGLDGRLIWLDESSDMRSVYNAIDVLASTSQYGEGFPNVVGEAMACGVPCVVTDVGDSARVVGDAGVVTPPGDPGAVAAAFRQTLESLATHEVDLASRARQRIVEHFSAEAMVSRTERAIEKLLE
jgi:glycosyltransferase involved in cell wall biosynthesis